MNLKTFKVFFFFAIMVLKNTKSLKRYVVHAGENKKSWEVWVCECHAAKKVYKEKRVCVCVYCVHQKVN